MRRVGRDVLLFDVAPLLVAIASGIGLVGGIADGEALVPAYFFGLICSFATIGIYGVGALFRTIGWLASDVR